MSKEKIKELSDYILIIIVTILVCVILNKYVFYNVCVNGSSMFDTLHENDRAFSFYFGKEDIKRFDIVVVDTHIDDKELVKRVIGLPNEKVVYKDNKLYINDVFVEEDFLGANTITSDFEISLNDDEFYVLGDNRGNSKDSRFYGAFKLDDIVSKHMFVYFPFNRISYYK